MKPCPHCSQPALQGCVTCGNPECVQKSQTSKASMRLRSEVIGKKFVPRDYSLNLPCAVCGEKSRKGQYRTHCSKHAAAGRWSSRRQQRTQNEQTFLLGRLKRNWRELQIQEAAEEFRKMTT